MQIILSDNYQRPAAISGINAVIHFHPLSE